MDTIEMRARELLAAEYERIGNHNAAGDARRGLYQPEIAAVVAALTPPDGSDQNLLELAATFETCIAFLPPAGRRNIAKAVDQLRYKGMTTAEGHVVVTRNEAGQTVAVTRQDNEGRILSVIAEFEPVKSDMGNPISVPDGYVLVSVDQDSVDFYVCDACGHHYMQDGVNCDCIPSSTARPLRHVRMLAARPEVKP